MGMLSSTVIGPKRRKARSSLIRLVGAAACACGATTIQAQVVGSGLTTGEVIPESTSLSATAPGTRTQTANVGITVGIGETDNVALSSSAAQSQTIALTGIDFGLIRTGSALDANLIGNFDYLNYLQNAYGSQLEGRFDGLTDLSLLSGRLKWVLRDDFGEGQLNQYAPGVPTNLEHINVVTTGPELTLRPMADTVVRLGAQYANSTYETSPLNGWRLVETATLERDLSANSNVAAVADVEQLKYQNTVLNTDYDREKFYVRYDIEGARTQIKASVGEAQVNDGGAWTSTPIADLLLTRTLSQVSMLTFATGRQLTDAADSFSDLRSGAAGGIVVAPVAETSDSYVRNYASLGLHIAGLQTTVNVTANWERDFYSVDLTADVTHGDLEIHVARRLTRALAAEFFGTAGQSRYFNQDGTINNYVAGAGINWLVGRTLTVEARYSHDFQGATISGSSGYSANVVFVTVSYRPLGQ
jgi:hypothetical protein